MKAGLHWSSLSTFEADGEIAKSADTLIKYSEAIKKKSAAENGEDVHLEEIAKFISTKVFD